MLTRLTLRNFKRFDDVEIELGDPVVFIGPNNSGKTTALQGLALWEIGLRRWMERRSRGPVPERRPGVTINRRDLIALPVPGANQLWRDLHIRDVRRAEGRQVTSNVRIETTVEGIADGAPWRCGLEFDYANEESFYCRPLRIAGSDARMEVPAAAGSVRIAYLPPMSGLAASETRLDPGAIDVRLGEGRTAEILRNLCYQVVAPERDGPARADPRGDWERLTDRIGRLFGVQLDEPRYVPERGEIVMTYRERGVRLDLTQAGRGLQQTLLLLAHLAVNPGAVLLLDEPDAHLEVLRQRQIYREITEAAAASHGQIIAASHSEIVLNEAAGRHTLVAFVGKPHRVDDRGSQVLKSLAEIGFDQYAQAEQAGWILYLEGSTDLEILRQFALRLAHPAADALARPFVRYVGNQPTHAREHFYALREATPDLRGFLLLDRGPGRLQRDRALEEHMWARREIENYLCTPETLVAYAGDAGDRLAGPLHAASWRAMMERSIAEVGEALRTLGRGSPWDADTKVSDDFLAPLFRTFYAALGLPNVMEKSNFHVLATFVDPTEIDPEVQTVLDAIARVSRPDNLRDAPTSASEVP